MSRLKTFLKKNDEKMQDPEYVKKLYKRSQIEILAIFMVLAAVIYFNYNYIMFKVKLSTEYIYTDTLNRLSNEHLDKDFSARDLDALTISLYSDKLQSEDKYFQLYKRGEFIEELKFMEDIGDSTEVYKTDKGNGVIAFSVFAPRALKNVKKELGTLKDCDTVIIDLRDNTGGMVDTAEKFASLFLDKGDVIYSYDTKTKHSTVKCSSVKKLSPQQIIILQNEWTASASEIFIMALKENLDNVTVVGTQSYGKGIGQNEYFLADGYGFKFTAMRLYTPSGGSINGVGITPDVRYRGKNALEYAESEIR